MQGEFGARGVSVARMDGMARQAGEATWYRVVGTV